MKLIDTHAHLFLPDFDKDRKEMLHRAMESGVEAVFLPNIDAASIDRLIWLSHAYENYCYPMLGLHPCSVDANFEKELYWIEEMVKQTEKLYGIGEVGIDLYWDRQFKHQQIEALKIQAGWAIERNIPLSLHTRDAFEETYDTLYDLYSGQKQTLNGVFHCFAGNADQAARAIDLGFKLGIGGVLTFKNSNLTETLKTVTLKDIVLETDAPYLAPVPFRGKRNESSYLKHIVKKLAEIYQVSEEDVANTTTMTAKSIFRLIP